MTTPEHPQTPGPPQKGRRIERLINSLTRWKKLLVATSGLIVGIGTVWGAVLGVSAAVHGVDKLPNPSPSSSVTRSPSRVDNQPLGCEPLDGGRDHSDIRIINPQSGDHVGSPSELQFNVDGVAEAVGDEEVWLLVCGSGAREYWLPEGEPLRTGPGTWKATVPTQGGTKN